MLALKKSKTYQLAEKKPSTYKPDKATADVIKETTKHYQTAEDNRTLHRNEFNGRNFLEEIDVFQKAFNSYVPARSSDPDESWRAQTVRPITRNKLISIAAHVIVTTLYPEVFAQNSDDKEDLGAAAAMRLLVEYNIENSKYKKEFLNTVIGMLTDPFAIMHVDFTKVIREIKTTQNADGTWNLKKIVDEVLSGFQANYVPAREIYFTNFYEPNVNKQNRMFRHRLIDYSEAQRIAGAHKDFIHVTAGVRNVFVSEEGNNSGADSTVDGEGIGGTFYGVPDTELQGSLVAYDIEYSYALDLELEYMNGVLVSDINSPLKHPDHVLPFAKSGYEPLNNGMCFCYFSAARKLGSDQSIVDTLYNMVIDGTFMSLMPPQAIFGREDIDGSVIVPGAITSFRDTDTKIESLAPKTDIRGGMQTIGMVEKSMSESTSGSDQAGINNGSNQTARQSLLLEKNAQIAGGMFFTMIGFLVEDVGKLMVPLILRHMTVADLDGLLSPMQKLKFGSFIVPNKIVDGKKSSAKLRFSDEFMNFETMTPKQVLEMSYNLLNEEGMDSETKIYNLNPPKFRDVKYTLKVDPDQLNTKSKSLEKALNLELYDRAIQNPRTDQDKVTQDFLFDAYKPGEGYKYMKKVTPEENQQIEQARIGGQGKSSGINQNTVGQLTGSNSLEVAASSEA